MQCDRLPKRPLGVRRRPKGTRRNAHATGTVSAKDAPKRRKPSGRKSAIAGETRPREKVGCGRGRDKLPERKSGDLHCTGSKRGRYLREPNCAFRRCIQNRQTRVSRASNGRLGAYARRFPKRKSAFVILASFYATNGIRNARQVPRKWRIFVAGGSCHYIENI